MNKEVNIPRDKVTVVEDCMSAETILDLAILGRYMLISSIDEGMDRESAIEWMKCLRESVLDTVDKTIYIPYEFKVTIDTVPHNGRRNIYLFYDEEE